MSSSVSSIVIEEDGTRRFLHNSDRGEYGDTVGSDIRAFEQRMEQGGTARSFMHLRSKGTREVNELILPDNGFIMVYDFQGTRMGAVDTIVYGSANSGDAVEASIAINELDTDEPRMTEAVGTSDDNKVRYGKKENKTILDWVTQYNERYGKLHLLAGWDNHGNPVQMDTLAQRESQRAEAAIYITRILGEREEQTPATNEPNIDNTVVPSESGILYEEEELKPENNSNDDESASTIPWGRFGTKNSEESEII